MLTPLRSIGCLVCLVLGLLLQADGALAQSRPPKPQSRRQFVTFSLDGLQTMPLHFKEHPLEDLVGQPLGAHLETADYQSKDGKTTIDVLEFRRRRRGGGVMVYPFGARTGVTLALRGSFEDLPVVRFVIDRPEGRELYNLTDGRAFDLGVGLAAHDQAPGWTLGSHAFILGGIGRLTGERGSGSRMFAEAGGGVNFGPFGVQIGFKVAYNRLSDPRPHQFYTAPFNLRGTVSF